MVSQRERIVSQLVVTHKDRQYVSSLLKNFPITQTSEQSLSCDVIIVSGATMQQHPRTHRWSFPGITQSDSVCSIAGGHSRAIAAVQLVKEGYQGKFLVTGGYQLGENGEEVSKAEKLGELLRRRGVPPEQVIVVGKKGSGNTLGNIADTKEYIQLHHIPQNTIGLLTNDHQSVRMYLMALQDPLLSERNMIPLIADEVLRRRSVRHAQWVESFQQLPEMQEREAMEVQGIKDLFQGTYLSKKN